MVAAGVVALLLLEQLEREQSGEVVARVLHLLFQVHP
jgi:hypothetical protein